jgi:hypothetical protein
MGYYDTISHILTITKGKYELLHFKKAKTLGQVGV